MRVVFAALFVFGSMLGTVAMVSLHFDNGHWPLWAKFAPAAMMLSALFASLFIFNGSGFRPKLSRKTLAEQISELEGQGRLVRQQFQALRAFGVAEFEDEGLHYFIELLDGRVLFLSGQYLYDFEPISDDPELNQLRQFPCTEFEVLRHKDAGYVIDINCAGTVFEPELCAPAFTKDDWKCGIPADGEIIEGKGYEALKGERAHA